MPQAPPAAWKPMNWALKSPVGDWPRLLAPRKPAIGSFWMVATKTRVSQLFEYGVKAVIATSVKIDDRMATEFAEQFYLALSSHSSIKALALRLPGPMFDQSRPVLPDFWLAVWGESVEADIPGDCASRPGAEEALLWSIAHNAPANTVVRNRYDYRRMSWSQPGSHWNLCEPLAGFHPPWTLSWIRDPLDIPSIKGDHRQLSPFPLVSRFMQTFYPKHRPGTARWNGEAFADPVEAVDCLLSEKPWNL